MAHSRRKAAQHSPKTIFAGGLRVRMSGSTGETTAVTALQPLAAGAGEGGAAQKEEWVVQVRSIPTTRISCASVCAAPALNAAGESRVTLSLRQERLRAALGHGGRKAA